MIKLAKSKYKTVTAHHIDYKDWQAFVRKHYGIKNYDVLADEELSNGDKTAFKTKKGAKLEAWDLENLADLKADRATHFPTKVILQDLIDRGIIPAGTWIIEVYW